MPWRTYIARAALAMSIASGLASCTDQEPAYVPNTPDANYLLDETSPAPLPSAEPPEQLEAFCDSPDSTDPVVQRAAAERCIALMKHGRVALVTFEVPRKRAQRLADRIEESVSSATRKGVNVSLEVVPASSGALKKLDETLGSQNCLNQDEKAKELDSFPSAIAGATMPELKKYDIILAASNTRICKENTVGVASDPQYADILLGSIAAFFKKSANANKLISEAAVDAGGHELMHLYNWGHIGVIGPRTSQGGVRAFTPKDFPLDKVLYLDKYLRTSRYEEYSIGEIMGAADGAPNTATNPVQLDELTLPREVLEGEAASPSEVVGADPVIVTDAEAAKGMFARVVLDAPICLTPGGTVSDHGGVLFDGLAVVATHGTDRLGQHGLRSVKLYFTSSESRNIALFGTLGTAGGKEKSWIIRSGHQTVTVDMSYDKLTVTAAG